MKIYHIAAISENHVIGKDGGIPWDLPSDLKRFQQITKGHPIIMGSKTFKSLGYQPLKGRRNIVIGHSDAIYFDNRTLTYETGQHVIEVEQEKATTCFVRSIEDALIACGTAAEAYIIGGGSIYAQTLDLADELRLTIVHREIDEDSSCVYYPDIDENDWYLSFTEPGETHSYVDYVRAIK